MRLLTARGAISVWILYVALASLIQYFFSHTLYTDDAMGSLLTQDLRLGYSVRNPPLWEWVLWTIQQGIGPGFESHWILRYICIALLGVVAYDASFTVSRDERWSAAVTLSLPLFYSIGWAYFSRNTYSLAIVIVCLLTLSAAIRYTRKPSFSKSVFLGLLVGLGFLSKYNYAIFIGALFISMLTQADSRRTITRKEFVLVPIVALLTTLPFLYWLFAVGGDLVDLTRQNLITSDSSHLSRVLQGLGRELEVVIAFLFPWTLIAAGVAWHGRRIATQPMRPAGFEERLAGLTLLISVVITTVGIMLMGVTKLNAAYIFPILIAAVPYSAAVLSRAAPGTQGPTFVAGVAIAALVVVLLLRLAYLSNSGLPEKSERRDMWPFAELADRMKEAGLDQGTLVTVSYREGGNLRAQLPELRVVTLGQADATRPAREGSHATACHLLWNDTVSLYPEAQWPRSEEKRVFRDLPNVASMPIREFDVPWPPSLFGEQRVNRWKLVTLEADDPVCR